MSADFPTAWHALYRAALLGAYPWTRWRLWRRARKEPAYGKRIAERYGHVPQSVPVAPVWLHAVSAGETIAAAPLIRQLAGEFPGLEFLVTTTTPAGSAQVEELLGDCANVSHCYAPYDFAACVMRFFDRVQPRLLVLMETELWPNQLARAARDEVPVLLVNARLSEKSAAGYSRISSLTRAMLEDLRFIACQYPAHAERFLALGARPVQVGALGSVKFDVALPDDHADRVADMNAQWRLSARPVWIAGSTHGGEEAVVVDAHKLVLQSQPDAVLIIVPRHPSRAEEVAVLLERRGLSYARQSFGNPVDEHVNAILADSMGQLMYLYGLSDVAFLGGSLVSVGGHNPIEAAVCGQPLIMGPETFNFPEVVAAFTDAGCLTMISDAPGLAGAVSGYLADPALRATHGAAARQVVLDNRGALDRLLQLLRAEVRAISG